MFEKKKVFSTFFSHFSTDSVHFESYRYVSTTATSVLTGTPRQRLRTRRVLRSIRPDSVLKVRDNGTLRHWKKNFRADARTRPFVPRPGKPADVVRAWRPHRGKKIFFPPKIFWGGWEPPNARFSGSRNSQTLGATAVRFFARVGAVASCWDFLGPDAPVDTFSGRGRQLKVDH